MPTFCRHNRFIQNCAICSPREAAPERRSSGSRTAGSSGAGGASTRSRRAGVRVVRAVRAAEDGYASSLTPGLKASADAARLADELAFSAARLARLATDPPGVYAEIASAGDVEEATWLAFETAYLAPLEDDDPFAALLSARTPWAAGALPDLSAVATGPRTAHDPARGDRTLAAYRAWASRAGSQQAAFSGEPSWTPERRFARVFERLSLPGFHRAARFDLLITLGRLGVYDLRADALHLGTGDETELAAKRIFGIGDRALLERRAADLADAAGVPIDSLDLALFNWGAAPRPRVVAGVPAAPDEAVADRIRAELGVAATAPA